jgi:hypothetical protein
LIDFDTDKSDLEEQHQTWLSGSMTRAKANSSFYIRLFGYASHLGDGAENNRVSQARMNEVLKFLQRMDSRAVSSLEMWMRFSDAYAFGGRDDNSPEYRAVEIHIFIGDMPVPPPPPNSTPIRHRLIPLNGGPRYRGWSVASPGGVVVTPLFVGPSGGFNMFVVKNNTTGDMRGYIVPSVGGGVSPSIPGLKGIISAVGQIFTSTSYSSMSFTPLTASHAVTWEEIEACLVTVTSAGFGVGRGVSTANIKFESPGVNQYGPSSVPITVAETIFNFSSSGKDWQLGGSATAVAGVLHRIG